MHRIVRMFRSVVERFPERPALWIEGGDVVAYQALWDAAEETARRLQEAGAGPGAWVALALEKSPEYVAAVWGCWLAGAAFCPLPPSLPAARRREMLARLAPQAVLTSQPDADAEERGAAFIAAPSPTRRAWCDGDAHEDAFATHPHEQFTGTENASSEDAAAYMIFTSGSTGRPKGVEVSHRGLPTVLQSQIEAFRLTPRSRCLIQLSILFDAHLSDLGTALLAGATLCLEPPERFADPAALVDLLHARGVTHWDLPPSLLPAIAEGPLPSSLECLVFGGEPADAAAVRKLASRVRMVNVYGPTEATICTSLCACDAARWTRPLLGSPLSGVTYRVCDEAGRPQPTGAPGELWIAGPALAVGYRDEPALTAEKFPCVEGRRWYRTGDRVVEASPGEWEFLGRLDRQFKRRGRLVQPEEIEAALHTLPGVLGAALLQAPLAGSRRTILIGFLESDAACGLETPDGSAGSLAAALPAWMAPQRIVRLERLPRGATGKIDYAALERRAAELFSTPWNEGCDDATNEPASPALQTMRDLWRRVLEVDRVGLDDAFPDLGGDSVDAFHLAALAAAAGETVSPVALLQGRTLRQWEAERRGVPAESHVRSGCQASAPRYDDDPVKSYLHREAFFAPQIRPLAPDRTRDVVVLTGATGLLGRAVLRELLRSTAAEVVCLARASDDAAAAARVASLADRWPAEERTRFLMRVRSFAANLTAPEWGLSSAAWKAHLDPAADFFLLAADVSLARDFAELEAVNVRSLLPALAAVRRRPNLRLHFASSLAVFAASDQAAGAHAERPLEERGRQVFGGYAQSKWAAERLLSAFEERERKQAARIHRFGLLAGDADEAAGCGGDQHGRTVAGLLRLGRLPPLPAEAAVNLVAASAAARALVALRKAPPGVYHLAAPENLSAEAWLALQPSAVRRLPKVSAEAFRQAGRAALESAAGDATAAEELATAFFGFARGWRDGSAEASPPQPTDFFLATGATFETACTAAQLEQAGVPWRLVDCVPRPPAEDAEALNLK